MQVHVHTTDIYIYVYNWTGNGRWCAQTKRFSKRKKRHVL